MTVNHSSTLCKQKFIAFHRGELLSEYILDYIIHKALCGLMTPAGAKLILIPDTRHGKASVSGLRMIGKKLAHYAVLDRLGAGGMGEVYLARDEHLGREVAPMRC